MDQNRKAIISLMLAASLWGLSFLAAKLILTDIPPFTMAVFRFSISVIIMLPIALRQKFRFKKIFNPLLLLTGFIGITLGFGLQNYGLTLTTSGNSALIFAGAPAVTVLFSWLILKEKISLPMILGVLLSIAGVILLVDFQSLSANQDVFWGNVLVFISMLTAGAYVVLVKIASKDHTPMEITMGAFIIGILCMIPFSAWEWISIGPPHLTLNSVLGLLYLAVLCSSLAFPLWNYGIKFVDASVSAPFINLTPVIGFLAAMVIGETVSWIQVIGGVITIAGVYICTLKQGEESPEPEPA